MGAEIAGERGLVEDLASAERTDPATLLTAGARLADRLERLRAPEVGARLGVAGPTNE